VKIKIHVVGLGFVGLTTALAFAQKKLHISGVETNTVKLRLIKEGQVPFYEPMLKERLIIEKSRSFLDFNKNILLDKKKINLIFVCVGTPAKKNGEANLIFINKIIKDLNKNFKNEKIVLVIKSTIPPGSCSILKQKLNKNISLASNPEFLREGFAWIDFFNPGRIILGHEDDISKKTLLEVYKKFNDEKILVNNTTAEFMKYLSNIFLSNLISFSNEMAMFAEKFQNIDIKKSFHSLRLDNRWYGYPAGMTHYLNPGMGYGGYCLPKDTKALSYVIKKFKKNNIVKRIVDINDEIIDHQTKKIIKLKDKKIFILGLSFKPNSDDIRESRSILLIKKILKYNKKTIFASDPLCSKEAKLIFKDKIKIFKKPKLLNDTTYILATPWAEYITFLKSINRSKILDLRYIL
tara:strand:- start:236 stop:1456 length:1221 start_codon:yes stop_codon:yes gene_type:complete